MSALSGRRRRLRSEGARRIGPERRIGGLVRWQGFPRRAGGARPGLWIAIAAAAVLLILFLIAARTAGGPRWGGPLLLVPAAGLLATLGAAFVVLARRALAWLAG